MKLKSLTVILRITSISHLYRASHLLTSCLQIFDHLNHFQPPPKQLWLTWEPQTCSRRQTCPPSFSPQSSKLRGLEPSPGLILKNWTMLNCMLDITYFVCSDSTEKPSEALLLFKGSCCLCECDHLVNLNLRNHRLQAFLQWFHQLKMKIIWFQGLEVRPIFVSILTSCGLLLPLLVPRDREAPLAKRRPALTPSNLRPARADT